jgi:hypothetical protein
MEWFRSKLAGLRVENRQAVVIGHVPPVEYDGTPLYNQACLEQYKNIVVEYSDILISQYFGHVNKDLAYLMTNSGAIIPVVGETLSKRSMTKKRFVSTLFTSPSIVPYYFPGFRHGVFQFDGSFFLSSHEQYYFNITRANLASSSDELTFQPSCNTKNWKLDSLRPKSWRKFFKSIRKQVAKSKFSALALEYQKCAMIQYESTAQQHQVDANSTDTIYLSFWFLAIYYVFLMISKKASNKNKPTG